MIATKTVVPRVNKTHVPRGSEMTVWKKRWLKLLRSSLRGGSRQREDEVCILVEEEDELEAAMDEELAATEYSARPLRLSSLFAQAPPHLRPEVAIVRLNASSLATPPYVRPAPVTTAQSSVVARAEPAEAEAEAAAPQPREQPAALTFHHRPTSSFPHLRALILRRKARSASTRTQTRRRVFAPAVAPRDRPSRTRREEDLDRFLAEMWTAFSAAQGRSRRVARKAAKLRSDYERRLAELAQREATFASRLLWSDDATPLLSASETERMVLDAGRELAEALRDARRRFDRLRYELKSEVARAAVSLWGRVDGQDGSIASCKLSPPVVEERSMTR